MSILMVLSGCMVSTSSLEREVITALKRAETDEISKTVNHSGLIFSYYLPTHLGKIQSTQTSLILLAHQERLVVNVDVISVVHSNIDADLRLMFSQKDSLFTYASTSIDSKGFKFKYQTFIYPYENAYFMILQTPSLVMSAQVSLGTMADLSYEMLRLARTIQISKKEVSNLFSNREILNYQKTDLNMFAQLAPESGTVLDMIEVEDENLFNDEYYNDYFNDSPTEEEILQD